jgi:murein hydrolase activator
MSVLRLLVSLGIGQLSVERDELKERLDEEKAAFARLQNEKTSLASLLESLEQLTLQSAQSAKALEKKARAFDALVQSAAHQQQQLENSLALNQATLQPKLLSLYRLSRRRALVSLLEASDLSSFLREQRVVSRLVETDVAALRRVSAMTRYAHIERTRVERLAEAAQTYASALKSEQAIGNARLLRFREMLAQTTADANLKSRSIADLKMSERELSELIDEDNASVTSSGFRALRGKLTLPTKGLVEVGFGKVINPRFNTVTVQKGLDVRAELGAEVSSLAPGTVAFVGWLKGYGNVVIIDHGDDFHTVYAHLANVTVEMNHQVAAAGRIGQVGDTGSLKGAFLYFEIRRKGQAVDPQLWLAAEE